MKSGRTKAVASRRSTAQAWQTLSASKGSGGKPHLNQNTQLHRRDVDVAGLEGGDWVRLAEVGLPSDKCSRLDVPEQIGQNKTQLPMLSLSPISIRRPRQSAYP